MYKVVIPSAGLGSRVGPYTKFINKALITIAGRPAISHVITKFDSRVEIVILLGYKGSYVRQVVEALHGDRSITYVDVDKFQGPGSGLGYSMLCAEKHLQCPFIFVANDTIVPIDNININPTRGNWIGYFKNDGTYDLPQYRTLEIEDGIVSKVNPKGVDCNDIYIGAAGIRDWQLFWNMMHDPNAIEIGEAYGLQALRNARAVEMPSWCDTGNMMALEKTKKRFGAPEHNVLEKESEAIWFLKDRVIKFSTDESFIRDRLLRVEWSALPLKMLPKIVRSDTNLYVYEKARGKMLSETLDARTFHSLFTEMRPFWVNADLEASVIENARSRIIDASMEFYKTKTEQRLETFLKRFEVVDQTEQVNGISTLPARQLLEYIDWKWLTETVSVGGFHGDFHCENIVETDSGQFILLDWRQNFGNGNYMLGDVYYDLAKFYHGLVVPHSMIYRGEFETRAWNGGIRVDVKRPNRFVEVAEKFCEWVENEDFSMKKIRTLAALIYINSSALHEHEFAVFLYYFGRYQLQRLNDEYIDR